MKAQYQQLQTALANTNKRLLPHSAGCLSESVKKKKNLCQETPTKNFCHTQFWLQEVQGLSESIKKGKFVMTTYIQI